MNVLWRPRTAVPILSRGWNEYSYRAGSGRDEVTIKGHEDARGKATLSAPAVLLFNRIVCADETWGSNHGFPCLPDPFEVSRTSPSTTSKDATDNRWRVTRLVRENQCSCNTSGRRRWQWRKSLRSTTRTAFSRSNRFLTCLPTALALGGHAGISRGRWGLRRGGTGENCLRAARVPGACSRIPEAATLLCARLL